MRLPRRSTTEALVLTVVFSAFGPTGASATSAVFGWPLLGGRTLPRARPGPNTERPRLYWTPPGRARAVAHVSLLGVGRQAKQAAPQRFASPPQTQAPIQVGPGRQSTSLGLVSRRRWVGSPTRTLCVTGAPQRTPCPTACCETSQPPPPALGMPPRVQFNPGCPLTSGLTVSHFS